MRRYGHRIAIFIPLFLIVVILWLFLNGLFRSSSVQAWKAVDKFYQYEQEGNFAGSWEMFHPFMKQKFPKGHYLQDRAHVFMNHFGVETFTYSMGKPEKEKKWQPSNEKQEFNVVYKVQVIQVYKGKYGNFSLHQDVFVVQEEKDWMIIWDYWK
ncbi:hypothetical protein RRV45_20340 [Bacillus sp. DTU_2020_1000418_1_SI_GHA_SEK_038]|uniref:hypothetical protein n=1 Tax=Bacillus sp. DTU_2020_1000418_1_SI_GHA_SEK_038 TaxID=3077585 RepID=UPI0028EDAA76|nr:hypothetical protein [Bacillus sp. DTU_2020_1000418_1_SI_GHA_SEK_038]WNS75195.1 hypothetical protein RRV45_20340 [Bacillus sp. DTU_2020_1000418_1_SI_GHA_SEK_038]